MKIAIMNDRKTEKLTLHFDLNHCTQAKEFTLSVLGRKYSLSRHDDETFAEHQQNSRALALISESEKQRVSHFALDVEMPADAVGIHLVTCPSDDPNSLLPDLALAFVHVPTHAKRRHFRRRRKASSRPVPAFLKSCGVESIPDQDHAAVALDATAIITPFQAAETIIFNHPELMSARADIAANVLYNHITQTLNADSTLPLYISANGPGTANPYTYNTVATDPTGKVIVPIDKDDQGNPIVDKNGTPLTWPQQNGQNVSPQTKLSEGVVGSADGSQPGAAASALFAVLRSTKDDSSLKGQAFSVQHGLTSRGQTKVEPLAQPAELRTEVLTAELGDGPGFNWNLSSLTSQYGIDIDFGSLSYDESSSTLSLRVKNWANRSLSAYVQFYDEDGATIDEDGPTNDPTYIQMLTAGNQIMGIPVWTGSTTLSMEVPNNAVKGDIMLGGIGVGNVNGQVDQMGATSTGVFNYAIPTLLIGMSVGTTGARLYYKSLENTIVTVILVVVQSFLGAPALLLSALRDPRSLIGIFGNIAVGVIFSQGLSKLAQAVTGYATTTEVLEKVPIVGWIFQVISCAAGIGGMIATTVEVCESPATYTIEASRVIDVQVTVKPDPTHGTAKQVPIWPLESDHWEVSVQYKGGTTVKVTGSMSSIKPDTDLSVLFTGETAISSAPGAQIQVTANFYSANDWLCGQWTSQWVAAIGDSGTSKLSLTGSIVEFLVPLSSTTQYAHYQKLAYQNGHHVWTQTSQPTAVWSGTDDCSDTGNVLCRLVNITMNDQAYMLAYTYQASGQNLPLDLGTEPKDGQMYAFQNISVLGNPESGMKSPTVGFSLQPYVGYDQYGPAPLFTLPSSTYMAELDASNGKSVPADIRTAFTGNSNTPSQKSAKGSGSGNYTLPAGVIITVDTASAEWKIGPVGGTPLYVLRRTTDTINVFNYPTPAFSPRNYYLDSRSYAANSLYYLRQIALDSDSSLFDYTSGQSWGAFSSVPLDAMVVHPNGYVIGVNYENHKMMILQLPAAATDDADATVALPMSGKGIREGLLKGPIALTVAPDGRILILEQDNARVQAFDTMGNPVQCFPGPLNFTLEDSFATELNSSSLSNDFQQAYQQNIQPSLALLFSLPSTCAAELDAGTLSADIKQQFADQALPLSANGPFQILTTQAGSMWLLIDQGGGVTFDIRKNLYVNLNGTELFTLPVTFITDLNAATVSAALIQEFADFGVALSAATDLSVMVVTAGSEWLLEDAGSNLNYDITVNSGAYAYNGSTLLFSLTGGIVAELKAGAPPADLAALFTAADVTLSPDATVSVVTAGSAWTVNDPVSGVTYDITTEADLDVFHAAAFDVQVKAPNGEWLVRDKTNTYSFDIKPNAANSALIAQQLISTLPLKDPASTSITYLDIGTETKGFIYVLSHSGTGSALSDYHLDIYNPDGSWLCRTPSDDTSPGVNGGRLVVDQWRNVYTLNFESFLGPGNRTEPSVSTWIPSTPDSDKDKS